MGAAVRGKMRIVVVASGDSCGGGGSGDVTSEVAAGAVEGVAAEKEGVVAVLGWAAVKCSNDGFIVSTTRTSSSDAAAAAAALHGTGLAA